MSSANSDTFASSFPTQSIWGHKQMPLWSMKVAEVSQVGIFKYIGIFFSQRIIPFKICATLLVCILFPTLLETWIQRNSYLLIRRTTGQMWWINHSGHLVTRSGRWSGMPRSVLNWKLDIPSKSDTFQCHLIMKKSPRTRFLIGETSWYLNIDSVFLYFSNQIHRVISAFRIS